MSLSIVRAALETRLATWAAAQSTPLSIAFEDVSFVKPDSDPYLECFLIPNMTVNHETSGTRKTLYGLFQVNVWTPGGTGRGQAETLSQGVVDLFPVVPKLGAVSVEGTPSTNAPRSDSSGWSITPVLIKYRYEGSV